MLGQGIELLLHKFGFTFDRHLFGHPTTSLLFMTVKLVDRDRKDRINRGYTKS